MCRLMRAETLGRWAKNGSRQFRLRRLLVQGGKTHGGASPNEGDAEVCCRSAPVMATCSALRLRARRSRAAARPIHRATILISAATSPWARRHGAASSIRRCRPVASTAVQFSLCPCVEACNAAPVYCGGVASGVHPGSSICIGAFSAPSSGACGTVFCLAFSASAIFASTAADGCIGSNTRVSSAVAVRG